MRIERTGRVEPLTPQVVEFLTDTLSGVALDDIVSHEKVRIDYLCLRGLLAIELKTLEQPGTERLDNLTEELRQRDDWPVFLGSAPMEAFIKNTSDPEGIRQRVIDRVGRAIINHLKKANRQLEAHNSAFPRSNAVRLLVLVNEDNEIYDPHTVSYILWHALRRTERGRPLYEHVDGVLFLTQRHATVRGPNVTFPIVTVEAPSCYNAPWKGDVIEFVSRRWGERGGTPLEAFGSVDEFVTIDHIPETAPRRERWRMEYKRQPHLRSLTKEALRDAFDECNVLLELCFLKNPPIQSGKEEQQASIKLFSDFMQELAERAIPITEFPFEPGREKDAAQRLGLPPEVIDWLSRMKVNGTL